MPPLRPSRLPSPVPAALALLGLGVALSPLSTKIAGAVWLALCLWGAAVLVRRSLAVVRSAPLAAARAWLLGAAVAAALATTAGWIWGDGTDGLNAPLRLLMAAIATAAIVARQSLRLPAGFCRRACDALAVSCGLALACIVVVMQFHPWPRDHLPANAIVWALAIAFALCLLLPILVDGRVPPGRRLWWSVGAACGGAAILLSQTRGALGIAVWLLWLLVLAWRQRHGRWPLARIGALAAAAVAVAAALWAMPGDPLRMREAGREITSAESGGGFNTSMGTRVYLWGLAWQGLQESPWIGIGGAERLRRIKQAGDGLPAEQQAQLALVRTMGHVHNQYLHAMLDGGLVGLGAILAAIAGLAAAAWRLHRTDPLASRQMQGLLFIHVTAGFTNVNFAHNYYAVTLAVAIGIVLVCASRRAASQTAGSGPHGAA